MWKLLRLYRPPRPVTGRPSHFYPMQSSIWLWYVTASVTRSRPFAILLSRPSVLCDGPLRATRWSSATSGFIYRRIWTSVFVALCDWSSLRVWRLNENDWLPVCGTQTFLLLLMKLFLTIDSASYWSPTIYSHCLYWGSAIGIQFFGGIVLGLTLPPVQ
jgi:hypothetical protein